jgi:hypothetical protein
METPFDTITAASPDERPEGLKYTRINFWTYEQAVEFAKEHDSYLCLVKFNSASMRYGFRLPGKSYKPRKISDNDLREGEKVVVQGDYETEDDVIKAWFTPYLGKANSVYDIQELADNLTMIWNAYCYLKPGEGISIVDGKFQDVISTSRMRWCDGQCSYWVGVPFESDEPLPDA